ncbi:secreted protein, partial [Streptomyces griseoflavus Tu4000]
MRRGLVHVLAWLLATGAAVTLSWWGVSTVMTGTAYDPPRALPVAAADA